MLIHLERSTIFFSFRQVLRNDILDPRDAVSKGQSGADGGDDEDIKVSQIFSDEITSVIWTDHSQNYRGLRQGISSNPRLRLEVWQISDVAVWGHKEIIIGSSEAENDCWDEVKRYVDIKNVMNVNIVHGSV